MEKLLCQILHLQKTKVQQESYDFDTNSNLSLEDGVNQMILKLNKWRDNSLIIDESNYNIRNIAETNEQVGIFSITVDSWKKGYDCSIKPLNYFEFTDVDFSKKWPTNFNDIQDGVWYFFYHKLI